MVGTDKKKSKVLFEQLAAGVSATALPLLYTSSTQGISDGQSLAQLEEKGAVDAGIGVGIFHGFRLFRIPYHCVLLLVYIDSTCSLLAFSLPVTYTTVT